MSSVCIKAPADPKAREVISQLQHEVFPSANKKFAKGKAVAIIALAPSRIQSQLAERQRQQQQCFCDSAEEHWHHVGGGAVVSTSHAQSTPHRLRPCRMGGGVGSRRMCNNDVSYVSIVLDWGLGGQNLGRRGQAGVSPHN